MFEKKIPPINFFLIAICSLFVYGFNANARIGFISTSGNNDYSWDAVGAGGSYTYVSDANSLDPGYDSRLTHFGEAYRDFNATFTVNSASQAVEFLDTASDASGIPAIASSGAPNPDIWANGFLAFRLPDGLNAGESVSIELSFSEPLHRPRFRFHIPTHWENQDQDPTQSYFGSPIPRPRGDTEITFEAYHPDGTKVNLEDANDPNSDGDPSTGGYFDRSDSFSGEDIANPSFPSSDVFSWNPQPWGPFNATWSYESDAVFAPRNPNEPLDYSRLAPDWYISRYVFTISVPPGGASIDANAPFVFTFDGILPEPSSVSFIMLFVGMLFLRRKRKNK